jgi:ribonuclease P protein component
VLPADQRLRDSRAFRRTVRTGRRAGGPALVVHLRSIEPAGLPPSAPRVGFVVNKAVGNAVVRNRVRRRLQHLVKANLAELPASSELVVRALPPAAALSSVELGAELARCLERVRRGTPAGAATGAGS